MIYPLILPATYFAFVASNERRAITFPAGEDAPEVGVMLEISVPLKPGVCRRVVTDRHEENGVIVASLRPLTKVEKEALK